LLLQDPFISAALGPNAKLERMRAASLRLGSQGLTTSFDDHLLIIGDAAGHIDPLTGAGELRMMHVFHATPISLLLPTSTQTQQATSTHSQVRHIMRPMLHLAILLLLIIGDAAGHIDPLTGADTSQCFAHV
jgi:hypothetical protein